MPNHAQVTIIGHLGRDPETRYTPGGAAVTSFSMATSRKIKDKETTTWWRVSLWGKRGETLAQYLGKGDPVGITGEPYMSTYTGQDGTERHQMEVDARDFFFLGGKQDKPSRAPDVQEPDEDIPF